MKRPIVWMFFAMLLMFFTYRAISSEQDDARYFCFQGIWEDQAKASVTGTVEQIHVKNGNGDDMAGKLYLKDCTVRLEEASSGRQSYRLSRLYVTMGGEQSASERYSFGPSGTGDGEQDKKLQPADILPGNQMVLKGTIYGLEEPSNPGQFNQKAYYKGMGIYYRFFATEYKLASRRNYPVRSLLLSFKRRMQQAYVSCLPEKEAGIITAMILGEKSTLDLDVRQLYQQNGISHLLAISGLHVTILGMALSLLLKYLGLPDRIRIPLVILWLILYGYLTDFSISTSRAVIMMVMSLVAEGIGRSYDRPTALAFSAIVILLQKPFALFSSGFLMSFGAVLGIELGMPAAVLLVWGDDRQRAEKRRRQRRYEKEVLADHPRLGKGYLCILQGLHALVRLFLVSICVQLFLLPILLYFFFEIPVYSAFLNLFVLPAASLLVISAFIGGIAGCFWLPAGRFLLGGAHLILNFYDHACRIFGRLPGAVQVLGRPEYWEIVLYYLILFSILGSITYHAEKSSENKGAFLRKQKYLRILSLSMLLFSFTLFIPKSRLPGICLLKNSHIPVCQTVCQHIMGEEAWFSMTVLDVGQGDGIHLHTADGREFLVDGGSTSVSRVGTYRILPYLKSKGISHLDGIFLTHSDEDHMNGIKELLECCDREISVSVLYLPDVAEKKEGVYAELAALAGQKGVQVMYLGKGAYQEQEGLSMLCLNPVSGFADDSANAGSLTLSIRYGAFSCLLTGDLEGAGEDQVCRAFQHKEREKRLPEHYTVLKVAHHGSKNSTSEEMLEQLRPELSLISCGKNNRYGHPHPELLERLGKAGSPYLTTAQYGAVAVYSDGKLQRIRCFKK